MQKWSTKHCATLPRALPLRWGPEGPRWRIPWVRRKLKRHDANHRCLRGYAACDRLRWAQDANADKVTNRLPRVINARLDVVWQLVLAQSGADEVAAGVAYRPRFFLHTADQTHGNT